MILKDKELTIRTIEPSDLALLWKIAYHDHKEWMNWNGPYFHDPVYTKEEFVNDIGPTHYVHQKSQALIELNGELCGFISYYFDDGELGKWLEFGLIIYNEQSWGQGLGKRSCTLWIDHLFQQFPDVMHIGFTTWSKNERMMKLGDKVGMKLEGRIRKVRYYQSQYWDSIKYGILREEWKQ